MDHRLAGREQPLNADPAAQQRLLELQAADLELDQLARRRRSLPEVAELESLATEHMKLRDAAVAVATEVADLEAAQERADADVEQVRQRKERDRKRLDAGQVSAARELESLQSEIASLERRQAVLEETELDVMERLEDAQNRVAQLATDRDDVARRAQDVQRARDAAWAEIDKDAEFAGRHRAAVVAGIPADLLSLYEKVRAERGGVGASELRQRRCEGCRISIDPADLTRIRSTPPDVVVRCEECRRILVRTAESGL
ncbi:MAG: zinc ribbon domain-containing protein [Jiangellaceae bacterium]